MRIAVDAMGGDHAPAHVVEGAVLAARQLGLGLLLVGRREAIERELGRLAGPEPLDLRIVEAPAVIGMADPPTRVLRSGRGASIRVAVDAVARGEAEAVFSAGQTGATVLAAQAVFGMLPGVDRPALATTIPTSRGRAVLLDSGATVDCRPAHLVQFAAMGCAYARIHARGPAPRVGLLSIGEEAAKGNELTRDAYRLLEASGLNFVGSVEARDLFTGLADVIVCDGFTGNVALKVGEGLVDAIERELRGELSRTVAGRTAAWLSRTAFRRLRSRVDYAESGAAPLLGVAGLCLVGHGRSSARAVRNGLAAAARLVRDGCRDRVAEEIAAVTVPY
jgi:phosphate acyltransferase